MGGPLPRTLLFHATNSYDKELALKANGFWFYAAANALRANRSIEAQIFSATGARPRVVASSAAPAQLATRSKEEHLQLVVQPLLLAALLTRRLPALPAVSCRSAWARRFARA